MRKSRLTALVVCFLILVSALSPTVASAGRFTDTAGHWANSEIDAGAQSGWISGYEDGSFRPENRVTRAEFIKMAVAAAGLAPQPGTTSSFADAQSHWLSTQGWLGTALSNGLLDQPLYKTSTALDPDRPITRCEATVIAVRLAQPGTGTTSEGALAFSDAGQVPANMTVFVSRSVALGIITGFPDNTFSPSELLTRSQAVVVIRRALKVRNPQELLYARFLDVGQGDSCFISLPDGKTMLIDAGPTDAGSSIVKYLQGFGVTRLDYVIFTHPHEDHIGGAVAVLSAFDVGQVYMPKTSHTTQTYENLLNAIDAKGLSITEAKAGKVIIDQPSLKATLIGPGKSYEELNDWSAVLSLKYQNKTFLFEGDASSQAEGDMLLSSVVPIPKADVLKVAHHGSSSSTSEGFLKMVSPSIAVISVGASNDYGHPAQSTLDRLTSAGAKVYRTDENGTIVISTDGTTLTVAPEHQSSGSTATSAQGTATDPSNITVYIAKTGEKYHVDGCRYLSESKIPISLKDAKARGYGPCSVCKPPI